MTGNFNIRDSLWDLSFPHHSSISDNLLIIANLFNLVLSIPTNLFSTRYSNTEGEANSVINLMFFYYRSNKLNNHSIYPNWCLSFDHAPLTITISITEENISTFKLSQTSFSLYLHNQWTVFHKLSCTGKPQMRAIHKYAGCTKVTTND